MGVFTNFSTPTQEKYTNCDTLDQSSTEVPPSNATIKYEPLSGTVVKPSENVEIKFDIQGGEKQEFAFFQIGNEVMRVEGEPPYVVKYKIPSNKAGKISIHADTIGSNKEAYSFESHVVVVPEGTPVSISSSREDVLLSQVGSTHQLEVIGKYPDGSKFNIAEGELGTTYATESDTEDIITVSPDGLIEAKEEGLDSVLITNSDILLKSLYMSALRLL